MELRSIADVQARLNAFQAGDIDVAMDLGSEASRLAAGLPGHIVTSQKLTSFYFMMDMSRKPFDDPRVVQAFKLACDRNAMNANLQGGRAVVSQDLFFMVPGSEGYPSDWPTPAYDPQQAKRLLAAAGYPNGLSITMEAISGYPDMTEPLPAVRAAGEGRRDHRQGELHARGQVLLGRVGQDAVLRRLRRTERQLAGAGGPRHR